MRCIVGIVLFVGLCYAGIRGLDSYATSRELAGNPGISQRAAEDAAWKVVKDYHAYVYAAAGVITIALLYLPKLLDAQGSYNAQGAWREEAERRAAERNQRLPA
jgi:hypothetical protein